MNYKQIKNYEKLDTEHKRLVDYYIELLLMNQEREQEILKELCSTKGRTEEKFLEEYPRKVTMKIYDPEYPEDY
jgi:predicted transcriptional regulator